MILSPVRKHRVAAHVQWAQTRSARVVSAASAGASSLGVGAVCRVSSCSLPESVGRETDASAIASNWLMTTGMAAPPHDVPNLTLTLALALPALRSIIVP